VPCRRNFGRYCSLNDEDRQRKNQFSSIFTIKVSLVVLVLLPAVETAPQSISLIPNNSRRCNLLALNLKFRYYLLIFSLFSVSFYRQCNYWYSSHIITDELKAMGFKFVDAGTLTLRPSDILILWSSTAASESASSAFRVEWDCLIFLATMTCVISILGIHWQR
jgi:hypothetical protein